MTNAKYKNLCITFFILFGCFYITWDISSVDRSTENIDRSQTALERITLKKNNSSIVNGSNEDGFVVGKKRCTWQFEEFDEELQKAMIDNISQAFRYNKFVKIIFKYCSSDTNETSSHVVCTSDQLMQVTYVWSESALYFLGPTSLYWLTLFVINVKEITRNIELPHTVCLCHDGRVFNQVIVYSYL